MARPAGWLRQGGACLWRGGMQEAAAVQKHVIVLVSLLIVGGVVGLVFRAVSWEAWSVKLLLVELSLALSAASMGASSLAAEPALAAHEARAGLNVVAAFAARQLVCALLVCLQPLVFLCFYVPASQPFASWLMQLELLEALCWAASGLGAFAAACSPGSPFLAATIASVFISVFNSFSPSFDTISALGLSFDGARALLAWSPVRWVSEGLMLAELQALPPGWMPRRQFLMWQCEWRVWRGLVRGYTRRDTCARMQHGRSHTPLLPSRPLQMDTTTST